MLDRATCIPFTEPSPSSHSTIDLAFMDELMCSGRVSGSCSICCTRRVTLEWGKDRIVVTINGIYSWSFLICVRIMPPKGCLSWGHIRYSRQRRVQTFIRGTSIPGIGWKYSRPQRTYFEVSKCFCHAWSPRMWEICYWSCGGTVHEVMKLYWG